MATTGGGGGGRPRVRVRFLDEVGRHVLRRRGFGGCWFLVPAGARLVGDLAHALVVEFALAACCPAGVDLAIDGLHVPANQDIALVRDGDDVTVQCASALGASSPKRRRRLLRALEDDESESPTIPLSPSLSSVDGGSGKEEGEEEEELRRVMEGLRSRRLALRRKGKAARKKAGTRLKVETVKKAKPGKEKIKKKATLVATTQSNLSSDSSSPSSSETSSDSSNVSSSESSSSSSSESDSDSSASSSGEGTTSTNGGGKTPTMVTRTPETGGAALKRQTQSNGGSKSGGEAVAVETEEQKPRRQRRRQRRRRRDRNSGSSAALDDVPGNGASALATGAVSGAVTDSTTPVNVTASLREVRTRFPRSKAHFRFDSANGEAAGSGRPSDALLDPRRAPTGLEKYGPSSSDGAFANEAPIDEQAGTDCADRVNGANAGQRRRRQPGGDAGNATEEGSGFAPQRKKARTHRDEMWKRPYEVLASVLDKPQAEDAASKADLTARLAAYPSPPLGELGASSFQSEDIIAFKTLRLCLETWQPIVSEWQCGKVVAVDIETGVSLEMRELTASNTASEPGVHFGSSVVGDEASKVVPLGEFSELRYLGGPTLEAMQTAEGVASSAQ